MMVLKISTLLPLILVSAVNVAGCQPTASDSSGSSDVDVAKQVSDGSVPDPASIETADIFIQTFPEPNYPTPDTYTVGKFVVVERCLVFEVNGVSLRAVLPFGSQLNPGTLILPNDQEVALGETVTIKGAQGEFGIESDRSLSCPTQAILIGEIE